MKRISVLLLAVLCVVWGGCASTPGAQVFRGNPDYQEWLAIDMAHLTPAQQEALKRFKEQPVELRELDRRLIAEFPWIHDPLSDRDRVFLAQVAEEIATAIHFANATR